ncbi:MAG: dihydrofolate reductase [Flavobacteriales bacterium]|nr:dihydrofolate reductase [Flavobacteriales bacterium]
MEPRNRVFIATSMDGFIADKNNSIDWLNDIPSDENDDHGYGAFMEQTDALVMGRKTFETVDGFGVDWPYTKPVYVVSNTMKEVPEKYQGKITLLGGTPPELLERIHALGHTQLYIDGGSTIQHFLQHDLIDEMIITTIPVLLGEGVSLFGVLPHPLDFQCVSTSNPMAFLSQSHYIRRRG